MISAKRLKEKRLRRPAFVVRQTLVQSFDRRMSQQPPPLFNHFPNRFQYENFSSTIKEISV